MEALASKLSCGHSKTFQGWATSLRQAGSQPSIQMQGATPDPKIHVQPASGAYLLFLDLACCQNHRVQ